MSADDGLLLRRGWLYRVWFCGDGGRVVSRAASRSTRSKGGPQFQQHPARFPVGRRHQRCQRGAARAISAAAGGRRGVRRIVLSSAGPILEAAASQPANQPANQPTSQQSNQPANNPTRKFNVNAVTST